jgi:N,N'-diacetyllegionaminate synthase
MISPIRVGNRILGPGAPCFLAAEIGINHNGDMKLACKMIDAATAAGADAVKFQNYRTEDFIGDRSLTHTYVSQGKTVTESQYAMFKRCELSSKSLADLKAYCKRQGVIFFSTPTSETGIADLVRLGVPLLKNGSDYLVHLPLIRAMARTGLPTVLSAGMATREEIDDGVRAFREAGGRDLVLLHCTSSYPTPPEDVHLLKLPALASAFGCPVGFSDHTCGIVAAVGAVALGACFVEKHFTLDKNMPGSDHRFSADPGEFRAMTQAIRTVEKNLGESDIGPTPSEIAGRQSFRLSCVAGRDLAAGHCLTADDVTFLRPGTGLPPKVVDQLVGRHLIRNVHMGEPLKLEDIQK